MIGFTAYDSVEVDKKPYSVIDKENMRILESIVIIFMWFKSLYYLQLIPEIAPLVDIQFRVLKDIKYFILIFWICIVAFT